MSQNNAPQVDEAALLARVPELAQAVRASTTQAEAEAAITEITGLPAQTQGSFIKALSKQKTGEAADLLLALNTYAPGKEIRKEARRALLRLESTQVRPEWTPPITQSSAIQLNVNNAPRFWRGEVTQSREEGEMQLLLIWEQGYDYTDVRVIGFLLDFWNEGVKDCFVEVTSKRVIERRIHDMRAGMDQLVPTTCTLAEGKRLIEDALSVNTWRKTEPAQEFRQNHNLINQFIFNVEDVGADSGRSFVNPDLEDQEVIVNFLGAWSMGDYGLAYDLLTPDSSIRNGLSRDEWIERHRAWLDEAKPTRVELGFVHERTQPKSSLWVPSSPQTLTSRKEIEVGWSLELTDTPLAGTLREFPMGTAINKDTGRHWFWTNFMLTRAREGWRIATITDEGASVQGLPVNELQRRIKEYEDAMDALVKNAQGAKTDQTAFLQEAAWRLTQLLHLYDALIAKLPLDRQVNEDAYGRAVLVGNLERTQVYLERLVQRFPENRADLQRRLGALLVSLAYSMQEQGLTQRYNILLEKSETAMRDSLDTQNSAMGHLLLGELYLNQERYDEAEQEMNTGLAQHPTFEEQTTLEAGLGNIAMRRERMDEAIAYYQHVSEIAPTYPGIWFSLGFAYRLLGRFDEAEQSYVRAVEQEPQDIRPYSELTALYMNQSDQQKACDIIRQGVEVNPDSAHLHALYASVLYELGEGKAARRELAQAAEIDNSLPIVQQVREAIDAPKKRA
jgi:tetratricopeptide (TPR) repeat protein